MIHYQQNILYHPGHYIHFFNFFVSSFVDISPTFVRLFFSYLMEVLCSLSFVLVCTCPALSEITFLLTLPSFFVKITNI